VDRFAANTLRTLGIVVTAICVILGCLVLLLLALCFGMLSGVGSTGRANPQTFTIAIGAVCAAAVLIAGGVSIIGVLARGMVGSDTPPPVVHRPLRVPGAAEPEKHPQAPPPPLPVSDQDRLDHALESLGAMAKGTRQPRPAQPVPSAPPPATIKTSPRSIDSRHFSPASRTAIQQLGYAVAAKIVAEIALGIIGWNGALGVPRIVRVPFPVYRWGFIVWGLAAIAPNLVLLYALARRPGPRAFSYALVIPALHLLFGLFGHSAFLAFILRAGQSLAPLVSIIPWLLDILILYLAWKAIRLTGIEPAPERLIVASVVIFLYSSLLPLLGVYLNTIRPLAG
jgi:hypothetical protein